MYSGIFEQDRLGILLGVQNFEFHFFFIYLFYFFFFWGGGGQKNGYCFGCGFLWIILGVAFKYEYFESFIKLTFWGVMKNSG